MFADRVVETIERHIEAGVVGVSLTIVVGDEVRAAGGFGRLDIDGNDAVTAQTRFPIQSVTKSIVASAAMHWVEQGVIGLDDPVNRHLAPIAVANEWEARSPVTIRQLLTHTAGLPVSLGWGTSATLEEQVANEVVTVAEPGTRLIYANWGFNVIGYLIARLAGRPWDQAVDAAVLRPLGMRSTTVAAPASEPGGADLVTGHFVSQLDGTRFRAGPDLSPFFPGPPSGVLVSNVDDLARFLIAHLNGGAPVLAADTVADMHRVHAPLGDGRGGSGLGFCVDQRDGRAFFCHGGDGAGCTTLIAGYPEARVGVALLMNTGGAQAARSEIARAALESVLDVPASRAPSAGSASRPAPGRYESTYWAVPAEVTDDGGAPILTVAANPIAYADSVSTLTAVDGRWRADGGMFDGCELDFGTGGESRRFSGGVYPFEFAADETPVIARPAEVGVDGPVGGAWAGDLDTPLGTIPIGFMVNEDDGTVAVDVMGTSAVDNRADVGAGRVHARLDVDVAGFGEITLFVRLTLGRGGLSGPLYARNPSIGEIRMDAVLERNS